MTSFSNSTSDGRTAVDPRTLHDRIDRGDPVSILDVRGPAEFEAWSISGPSVEIVNIPGPEFTDGIPDSILDSLPEAEPLVVVCAKGISSAEIASQLRDRGIPAKNLDEGMEGWAGIFVRERVDRYEGSGTLYQYHRPSSGCLSYLLVDGDAAAVFDPLRAFADRYRSDAADSDATLEYAFDTHVHADHFSGVRDLVSDKTTGVLPRPAIERGVTYESEIEAADDGETFSVGESTVTAIHTPGHTSGMTSYFVDDSVLLTGDGLFTESIARPDLEEGMDDATDAAATLYESLQEKILTLSDDVLVAGGHVSEAAVPAEDGTYTATIGELQKTMQVLSLDEDSFVDRVLDDMPPRPSNYRTIIAANLGETTVDADEASQMELGPNNCATSTDALRGD